MLVSQDILIQHGKVSHTGDEPDIQSVSDLAVTLGISAEQLFYLQSRGIDAEQAIGMLVHGFCDDVFKHLPLEFSVEAVKLLEMKLEGSVG